MVAAFCGAPAFAQQQGPPPSPVRLEYARTEEVHALWMVTGELRAPRAADVPSKEGATIVELLADVGDEVKSGQVLARLDNRRIGNELEAAQADLNAAERLCDERDADVDIWQRELDSLAEAGERGAIVDKELRDARARLASANARYAWALTQVEVSKARVAFARIRLADCEIISPYNGIVVSRSAELGGWRAEGDTCFRIVDLSTLEARLSVPQRYYSAASSNAEPVQMRSDPGGVEFMGTSPRAIPSVDRTARSFELISSVANPERTLAPGMAVVGWAPSGNREAALTIPKNAVMRSGEGPYVYKAMGASAQSPGTTMPVRVVIRFGRGDRYVVDASGLSHGDLIVTEGNERLFPGTPVTAVNAEIYASPPAAPPGQKAATKPDEGAQGSSTHTGSPEGSN